MTEYHLTNSLFIDSLGLLLILAVYNGDSLSIKVDNGLTHVISYSSSEDFQTYEEFMSCCSLKIATLLHDIKSLEIRSPKA